MARSRCLVIDTLPLRPAGHRAGAPTWPPSCNWVWPRPYGEGWWTWSSTTRAERGHGPYGRASLRASSGTALRVPGLGVPAAPGRAAGYLVVTLEVDVPQRVTEAQRLALEQLAATLDDPRRRADG
jgi:hypothetical protein